MTWGRNVYRVQGFWVKTWAMQKTPWKEFNISCLRIPKDFPSPDFCIPEWKGCLILVIADVMAAKSDGVLIYMMWCFLGQHLYDVRKMFRLLDNSPPFHIQKSADFVPFVCFLGTQCGRHISMAPFLRWLVWFLLLLLRTKIGLRDMIGWSCHSCARSSFDAPRSIVLCIWAIGFLHSTSCIFVSAGLPPDCLELCYVKFPHKPSKLSYQDS